jgi:hypothetical protein
VAASLHSSMMMFGIGTLAVFVYANDFASRHGSLVQLVTSAWAQDKTEPGGPPYPGGSDITFQWDYSCPGGRACSFTCPGAGNASGVTKLTIYLGTVPLGATEHAPALFYEFSTRNIPRGNGFSITTAITTLSCQVNGMTLDYSGPPQRLRR